MLRALAVPSHGSGLFQCKWSQLSANVGASSRSLTTKKSDVSVAKGQLAAKSSCPIKASTKGRPLATSAQILPDGFVKPALYDESTPIPRCEAYPSTYHMGTFPWLLSAQRQRLPMEDLDTSSSSAADSGEHDVGFGDGVVNASTQLLPLAARKSLAHSLNMRIARAALGTAAMDGVCDGAADVLPRVASLLSSASSGDADSAEELSHIFTQPLLARYMRDLDSLRKDNVLLALEIHSVEDARIHQLRTQTGPKEAFAALDNTGLASSALSAGLTRQNYRYTSVLGNTHATSRQSPSAWSGDVVAAMGGKTPVSVRVDVELMVNMRYRMIGRHSGPSKHDRHNGTTKVIVDDDATRSLMLTLESSVVDGGDGDQTGFEWRVADIDYLLSSERRVRHELDEARLL